MAYRYHIGFIQSAAIGKLRFKFLLTEPNVKQLSNTY
jgi:hypothetical protein